MATIFLLLIYLSFISLGLPDTLLGSVWPVMQPELGAPFDAAGLVSLLIAAATILSSLLSERIVRRLGTGKITVISVFLTAAALFGFSQSPHLAWLVLFALPLGFGAGSVDTALNNYVSLHYSARHVNWLHCAWGVGAAFGPLLMSFFIRHGSSWRAGYFTISMIQFAIAIILLLALPLWRGRETVPAQADAPAPGGTAPARRPLFAIPGVPVALIGFALFFAIEYGTGLWIPSFLVDVRQFSAEAGAQASSIFYGSVTAGRFISGLASMKLSDKVLIRIGVGFGGLGMLLLCLPLPPAALCVALVFVGLGCAPIFPSMIHMTPARFGRADAPRIMGIQMAAAYAGSLVIPPLIGFIAARVGVGVVPFLILLLFVLICLCCEAVNRTVAKHPPLG